ncbi:hypothetical protein HZS_8032 [Henneguya salminicola]|nr:hypothetical protein HZS_8032 [Henneguya salminicola]
MFSVLYITCQNYYPLAGIVLLLTVCKQGFYGFTVEPGLCVPCLNNAICFQKREKKFQQKHSMKIPT